MSERESLQEENTQFATIKWLHFTAAVVFVVQTIVYADLRIDADVTPSIGVSVGGDCGPICPSSIKYLQQINVAFLIPLFTALAALDHIVCFSVCVWDKHRAKHYLFVIGSNPVRWAEYSLSASVMAVAVAVLAGVGDVHLWFLVFVMHAVGMGIGQVMELLPKNDDLVLWPVRFSSIRSYCFGLSSLCILAPWAVMGCYFFRAVDADVPAFVYAAFLGTFLLYVAFAVYVL
ncbi:hypothetical protein B484DRAFT_410515 [Ochromonadaceae sp. CCMP2298]|nr:hypothetical protein B484DRAFT_410515 [Ochromonadaceae sp. CCMP2298]